jgi:hypothetical protein
MHWSACVCHRQKVHSCPGIHPIQLLLLKSLLLLLLLHVLQPLLLLRLMLHALLLTLPLSSLCSHASQALRTPRSARSR